MNAGTRKLALWRHAAAMVFLPVLVVLVATQEAAGTQHSDATQEAAGAQEEEPEGIDTTDPEDSGADGAGTTSWLAFAIIGVLAVGSLVWYLDRLRRGNRGAGGSR